MHILLIHQAFAALDEPGGTRHFELAQHLAQRGHRVTVIASQVSYLTGKTRGKSLSWVEAQSYGEAISVLRAYTYPAIHRSFVHRVFSFFSFMFSSFFIGWSVREVDMVWGTSPPIFQGVTAWLLARLKGVPFLFEVRDLWPAFAVAVGVLRNPFLIWVSEGLERFLYRRAGTVVVNSPGFVEHVRGREGRLVELVPNGADTTMFHPEYKGMDFRRAHGLEGKIVVLYAGAHGMSNDLGVVLEAAEKLRNQPEIQFVLLGDGKEKSSLMERAQQMGLENLHFLPPVSKVTMPQVLGAADICVGILRPIPLYATVYPNKIFDYLAAGRPIVLAMEGVIREVVEAARAGIPVSPGDATSLAEAVRILACDAQLRIEMGQRGRRYVEKHFERTRLAEKFADVCERLIAEVDGGL
ncbi:MAG: glycosyltransferase family 4 protein [Chloroflexota bacterium]